MSKKMGKGGKFGKSGGGGSGKSSKLLDTPSTFGKASGGKKAY